MPLNDKQIKALQPESKPKKYFDGGGMYLEVAPNGSKKWRLKYRINGVEKRVSLGLYPEVSLAEAREKCFHLRKTIQNGLDPSQERKREQSANRIFKEVAQDWYEKEKNSWTPKHAATVDARLRKYIYPHIGSVAISKLDPPTMLSVCTAAIKTTSVYTARVILSMCSRIFRFGIVCGYITSDPCRDLTGALPSHKVKSLAALTAPSDIRRLLLAIDAYEGDIKTCCALKLLPLLMCRTGELRNAEWSEFDFNDKLWRIPGSKMKMGRDHLVPLSEQAIVILNRLQEVTGHTKFLFPGIRSDGRVMSNNTINAALRYMGFSRDEMTGHGFRSLASTRLNELGFRSDIIEKQLAHEENNTVRKVYNRAEYLDERRDMLQKWANYLDTLRDTTTQTQ